LAPRKDTPENIGYNYIIRRGQNGQYTYTHSMLRPDTQSDEKVILERSISGREYLALLKQSDETRLSVKKDVQFFIYNNVVYELQRFTEPDIGLTILKTEVNNSKNDISFPWFLNIKGEVTGIDEFSSYSISQFYYSRGGKNEPKKFNWKENQYLYDAFHQQKIQSKVADTKM